MIVGFDIGGTNVRAGVVDDDGVVVAGTWREDRNPGSPDDLCDLVASIVSELEHLRDDHVERLGVAIAGLVTFDGRVRYSPNIPELVEFNFVSALEERCRCTVSVENDANASAWAEHRSGAARGVEDFVTAALGTGIGTGLVLDGRLYRGSNGFAGESGHMVIERSGAAHHTGANGPWELYGSGTSLGALLSDTPFATVDDAEFNRLVEVGDTDALTQLNRFAEAVAVGACNLVYLFDPALVVLCGGVSEIGEPLAAAVEGHIAAQIVGADHRPRVPVAIAHHRETGGVIGAALLANQESR